MKFIIHDTEYPQQALYCAQQLENSYALKECVYVVRVKDQSSEPDVYFYARRNKASISVREC